MWKESYLGYHWFSFRAVSDWSRKSQASFLTNHMQNQPQWWLGRSCFPALEVVFTTYTLKQLTQALTGSSWNFSFQLSVEKPKPIKSQWPITIKLCIVISQWGIKVITGNFLRRGKVRMTKSLMFSVLNLICWEYGASILNHGKIKAISNYFRHYWKLFKFTMFWLVSGFRWVSFYDSRLKCTVVL